MRESCGGQLRVRELCVCEKVVCERVVCVWESVCE